LSGRGLCDELITRPEESYQLCCVVCDLETTRMGAPYIYDISRLRVKYCKFITTSTLTYILLPTGPHGHFGHFVIQVSTKTFEIQQL